MKIVPINQKEANRIVLQYHDHHKPVVGSIFQIGLQKGNDLVGAAICGRPVGRKIDYKKVIEVLRNCVQREPKIKNGCSMLYASCARIAKEMGYEKIITYTLDTETGISLKASGWVNEGTAGGKEWNSSGTRIRTNEKTDLFGTIIKSPPQMKVRWSKTLMIK